MTRTGKLALAALEAALAAHEWVNTPVNVRHWALRKLAGERTVAINVRVENGGLVLDGSKALVANCSFVWVNNGNNDTPTGIRVVSQHVGRLG